MDWSYLYFQSLSLAVTWDFHQGGILISVDSDEPVLSPFKAEKLQMMFNQKLDTHRLVKRLAKALISLRVCAG